MKSEEKVGDKEKSFPCNCPQLEKGTVKGEIHILCGGEVKDEKQR